VSSGTTLSASDVPSLTLSKISNAGTAAGKDVGTANDQVAAGDHTHTVINNDLSLNGHIITNVGIPLADTDVARKVDVDNAAAGLNIKNPVKLATITALTITGSTSSSITVSDTSIDGVNLSTLTSGTDRILVKDQVSNKNLNGIYVYNSSGTWNRATDASTWTTPTSTAIKGAYTLVLAGTQANSGFLFSGAATGTIGSTDITFAKFTTVANVVAGAGLTKSGDKISAVSSSSISIDPSDGSSINVKIYSNNGLAIDGTSGLYVNRKTGGGISVDTNGLFIDTGVVVDLSTAQTLTNKSISASQINSGILDIARIPQNSISITQSQVSSLISDLALKAPLASPTFTGTITIPLTTPSTAGIVHANTGGNLSTSLIVNADIATGTIATSKLAANSITIGGTSTALGGTVSTTGTGSTVALNVSPTLTTPVLGTATATKINNVTITDAGAGTTTLTLANGSTLATSGANSLTLTTTGTTNATLPSGTNTLSTLGANTYTGTQTATAFATSSNGNITANGAGTISTNSGNITTTSGTATIGGGSVTVGTAGTTRGTVVLNGSTSGNTTIQPAATASGTLTLPAATGSFAISSSSSNAVTFTPSTSTTVTLPTGATSTLARTDAGQTFTGVQVFTSPTISGASTSITNVGTFALRDTSAAFDLTIAATSSTALTAGRTLTLDLVNNARTLKLGANLIVNNALTLAGTDGATLSLAANLTTSGANAITFTGASGGSSVTLPSSGTLATTGANAFTGIQTVNQSSTNASLSVQSTGTGIPNAFIVGDGTTTNNFAITKGGAATASSLTTTGGLTAKTRTYSNTNVGASDTILNTDYTVYYYAIPTAGLTTTLPAASASNLGQIYNIKNGTSFAITVNGGGTNIDGGSTYLIPSGAQYQTLTVQCVLATGTTYMWAII
jgi:hypothetical protein